MPSRLGAARAGQFRGLFATAVNLGVVHQKLFRSVAVAHVAFRRGVKGPHAVARKLRNRDGGEKADDGHGDHQLDQGEAFGVADECFHGVAQERLSEWGGRLAVVMEIS